MTYTPDGQLATLTAVHAVTGDQTTRYVYGSTLVSSYVARSDLLVAEIYPDSDDTQFDDGDDAVPGRIEYTYNRQGQRKSRKDQNGTLRGFLFDKLGRLVHDYVEVLGATSSSDRDEVTVARRNGKVSNRLLKRDLVYQLKRGRIPKANARVVVQCHEQLSIGG